MPAKNSVANAYPESSTGNNNVQIALNVMVMFELLLLTLLWVYMSYIREWDPSLWYLNWLPGAYSLATFSSCIGLTLGIGFLAVGVVATIRRGSIAPIAVSIFIFALIIASLNDGGVRWSAYHLGLAQYSCFSVETRDCILNNFNRQYDLSITDVAQSPAERRAYGSYALLRERGNMKRITLSRSAADLSFHQLELARWAQRFNTDLDVVFADLKKQNTK